MIYANKSHDYARFSLLRQMKYASSFLLGFLFMLLLALKPASLHSQTYSKSTSITIRNGELDPSEEKTMYTKKYPPTFSAGCNPVVTGCDMYMRLTHGEDYQYGSNPFSYELTVEVKVYNNYTLSGSGNLLGTYTRVLTIDQSSPEQLIKTDISNIIGSSKRIVVTAERTDSSFACVDLDSVKLEVYYEEKTIAGGFLAGPTLSAVDPSDNPVEFSWSYGCPEVKDYEIQVLRLYNMDESTSDYEDDITTNVNWDEALSIETGSAQKSITLTLAEGTGYYVWRVRAIGNLYEGGISDPRNWGPWSNSGVYIDGATDLHITSSSSPYLFFYTQFDDSLNFIYSRVFTEGDPEGKSQVRISEQMTYANGLQQVRQQQAMVQSEDKLIVNEMLLDYAGRPALTTLGAPVDSNHLGYVRNYITNPSGQLYTAADFDANTYLRSPQKVDSVSSVLADYYSDNNPDLGIPTANGYPYSRVIYYGDGTGRPREQSGPGSVHKLSDEIDRHTTRVYYGSPSEIELVRVLGDEAPSSSKSFKTLTTDPNGSTSVSYINEQGQTIITCLVVPTDSSRFDRLPGAGQAAFDVKDTIDQADSMGSEGYTTMKRYVFTEPTGFGIRYDLSGDGYGDACVNLCYSCDYSVNIRIMEVRDTLFEVYDTTIRNTPAYGSCYSGTDVPHLADSITLPPGEYIVQKQVYLYNSPSGSSDTYLSAYTDSVGSVVRTEIKDELEDLIRILGNHDMDSLYLVYGIYMQDSVIRIPLAGVCDTLEIPLITCDTTNCTDRDFEALLDSVYAGRYYSGTTSDSLNAFLPSIGYVSGEFNDVIESMKTDGYNCEDLWQCWQGAVVGLGAIDTLMMEEGKRANLMEMFLQCTGTQYEDTTRDYETYRAEPYKYVYYPPALVNSMCEEQIFDDDIAGTLSTASVTEKDSLLTMFYGCIHNQTDQMPELPWGSTFNVYTVRDTIEDYCRATCESRMPQFISKLINYYHQQGRYVEGDQYALIPDLGDSIGYVVSHTPISLDTVVAGYVEIDSIYCLALKALKYCEDGCALSIYGDENGIDSIGTQSQYDRLIASMFFDWELTIPDSMVNGVPLCRAGYTSLDSLSSSTQRWFMLSLNQYLNGARNNYADTALVQLSSLLPASLWSELGSGCNGDDLDDPQFILHPDSALYFTLVCSNGSYNNLQMVSDTFENSTLRVIRTYPAQVASGQEFNVGITVTVFNCIKDLVFSEDINNQLFTVVQGDTVLPIGSVCSGTYNMSYSLISADTSGVYEMVEGVITDDVGLVGTLISDIELVECCRLVLVNNYYNTDAYRAQSDPMYQSICPCFNLPIDLPCGGLCVKTDTFHMDTTGAFDYTPMGCEEYGCEYMLQRVNEEIDRIVEDHRQSIVEMYHNICFVGALDEEDYILNYKLAYYHYTLYYYDRAGNLVRTVPPAGVSTATTSRMQHPAHDLVTEYEYNSLKQLVRQKTPDGGESYFWYDFAGRLRFSQNARQAAINAWSYTIYDDLSRIVEVGQAYGIDTLYINTSTYPDDQNFVLEQRTFTNYSTPMAGVTYYGEQPRYLQNRVSYSHTDHDGDLLTTNDQIWTYYSYDPHGNVEWLVQEQPIAGRSYVGYEYDLLSGSVLKVKYNEKEADRFFHRYSYDADKRITIAETSTDGEIWDRDARYDYYQHGPLKRTLIGEDQVQGVDYTYTIQGWLKAVNHPNLDVTLDPGEDGNTGSKTGQDLFGMTLGYYAGDYHRTYYTESSPFNTDDALLLNGTSLYNGNISSWTERTIPYGGQYDNMNGHVYRYDQLNRLKVADFQYYNGSNWNDQDSYFDEAYTYDGNGNIETLNRRAAGAYSDIDDLAYHYYPHTNQLAYVDDSGVNDGRWSDITDQADTNYVYDAIGNLIADEANDIESIIWNVYGKIDTIYKSSGDTLIYSYDATGNRVRKQLRPATYDPEQYKNTFYTRDAQGNIMATYSLDITGTVNDYDASLVLNEQPIYGSDRIGVRNPDLSVYSCKTDPNNLWTRPEEQAYTTTDSLMLFPMQNAPATGTGSIIRSGNPIVQYVTAQIATAAEGTWDMRSGYNTLTVPYNSRLGFSTQNTAVALNECGETELYAASVNLIQQTTSSPGSTTLLFGRNRNLLTGSTGINTDANSQSAFTRIPGSDNRWYYITLSQGSVWLHTIDATAGVVESTNQNLDPSSSTYGHTLALVEDNTGTGTGMLYVRRHNASTHKTELIGFRIDESGVGIPEKLAEFNSMDVSGDGEIQLSADASKLAVANKTKKSFLWLTVAKAGEVRLFDVNISHDTLSNQAGVLAQNFVNYVSLDFTQSGDYIYVMKDNGQRTPVKYNISAQTSFSLSEVAGGGDVRRGTDGKIYVASAKKLSYISSPEDATPTLSAMTWNYNYIPNGSLSPQPVRMGIYTIACGGTYARVVNQKQYELKDHLGNVRVTFSDLKEPGSCSDLSQGWSATATTVNNYYSFGMLQPNRCYATDNYRFGFNGKENDNEVYGIGNALDFGARIYDSRLGRWLSVDPEFKIQPGWSPYKAFLDNPLMFGDPDGGTEYVTIVINDERSGTTIIIRKAISNDLFTDNKIHSRFVTRATQRNYMYWYDKETTTTITIPEDGGSPIVTTKSGLGRKRAETFAPFNSERVAKALVTGLEGYGGENEGGVWFTTESGGASPTKFKSLSDATKEDAEGLLTMLSYAAGYAPPVFELSKMISKVKNIVAATAGPENTSDGGDTKPGTTTVGVSNNEYRFRRSPGKGESWTQYDTVPGSDTINYKDQHKGGNPENLGPIDN